MNREGAIAKVLELHGQKVLSEDTTRLITTLPLDEDTRVEVLEFTEKLYAASPPLEDYIYISRQDGDAGTERYKSVSESVTGTGRQRFSVTRESVEEWVRDSGGRWWAYEDLDRDFGIRSAEDKTNRRVIVKRLKDDGVIEPHPTDNRRYRFVNAEIRKIDFKRAGGRRTPLDVLFPFRLERYVHVYPGNIIVVAGSPDAGKTALLLNFVYLNQHRHPIYYQCSEMEADELNGRLANFENIDIEDWTFEAEKRTSDFADVIRPDAINIVDYLEVTTDLFMVADYLRAIHDKLDGGIALVAIQKKRNVDLGRGAEFSLEKPRLYLSMDAGCTTIQKSKNWVTPDLNPRGLRIEYKIVGGCKFIVTQGWHDPDEPTRDVTPRDALPRQEALAGVTAEVGYEQPDF